MKRANRCALALGLSLLLAGGASCRSHRASPLAPGQTPPNMQSNPAIGLGPTRAFENVAAQAGLQFTLDNGEDGQYMLPATMPGGCAFLDYDQDGWLDIFLVQAGPTPDKPSSTRRPPCALFHNQGDGTFRDVTREVGLDRINQGYAMAVVAGDYDNDGYPDLYITAYGGNHLLHNQGRGAPSHGPAEGNKASQTAERMFVDATAAAGVGDADKGPRWPGSAAWFDYDRDGRLDLIVLHYTKWNMAINKKCTNASHHRSYCSPEVYDVNEAPRLYRNLGGGRFADVSDATGIARAKGRGLGVLSLDYDQDGWPDLYIACDISPNLLLHNVGGKRFEEIGLNAGVAYGADAAVLSGMGISAGDYDNTGWQSLVVTNYSGQPKSVYHALSGGKFEDRTYQSGIGTNMNFLAFGVEFIDYDNDGLLDVIVGNGHVDPFISDIAPNTTYREPKQLFHNVGNGEFRDYHGSLGDMAEPRVTRGLAAGDFDNDGRVDILDNSHAMPVALFRNAIGGSKSPGNFVTLRLQGVKSNRDAVGALVWVTAGGKRTLAEVRDGSSYASTSDRRLHFGLGSASTVDKVEVRWPSGARQTFSRLPANRFYWLREGAAPVKDPRIKG